MITATYAAAALRPTSAATVVRDIAFIAGPTIRNTNAAPGETPFATSDAAIGMDAVEQTYIGKPTSAITGIAINFVPDALPATSAIAAAGHSLSAVHWASAAFLAAMIAYNLVRPVGMGHSKCSAH